MRISLPAQTLLRDSFLLLVLSQFGNAANLLFQMFMARSLSPDEYSVLVALMGMAMILGTPTHALVASVAHYSARFLQSGRGGDILRLLLFWMRKTAWVVVPLATIALLFHARIASFYNLDRPHAIWAMIFVFVLTPFPPLLTGVFQGIQNFFWMAMMGCAFGWLKLGLGILLVYRIAPTAALGLLAQGLSFMLCVALGMGVVLYKLRGLSPTHDPLPSSQAYFLKSCLILTSFGILASLDMTLIRRFLPEQAGQASYAFQLARMAIFLPMPIAMALFPKVTSQDVIRPEDRRNLRLAMLYAALIIGGVVGGCVLMPRQALRILGAEVIDAQLVRWLRLTLLALAPLAFAHLLMNFELAQHRFSLLPGALLLATVYVGGVWIWHGSVDQVIAVLALCSTAFMIMAFWALPRREAA